MSRLQEIDDNKIFNIDGLTDKIISFELTPKEYVDLYTMAERAEQLEYASKHNGELNEFLQKRNLPPKKILGRHVVEVTMDYVEELEKEVEHHKNLLNKLQDDIW